MAKQRTLVVYLAVLGLLFVLTLSIRGVHVASYHQKEERKSSAPDETESSPDIVITAPSSWPDSLQRPLSDGDDHVTDAMPEFNEAIPNMNDLITESRPDPPLFSPDESASDVSIELPVFPEVGQGSVKEVEGASYKAEILYATDRRPELGKFWSKLALPLLAILTIALLRIAEQLKSGPSRMFPRLRRVVSVGMDWIVNLAALRRRGQRHVSLDQFAICGVLVCAVWLCVVFVRVRTGSPIFYGARRGKLVCGKCVVSIPKSHRVGHLEAPDVFWFEVAHNPEKHVILRESLQFPSMDSLASELAKYPSNARVLLFVHGFHVSFEDAARRTGQLAYDLKFDGVSMFFSWPSVNRLLDYGTDAANSEWAIPDLREVIERILESNPRRQIFLIAHSMGNRTLTRALMRMKTESDPSQSRIREVILTAPDIDAGAYQREIVPAIAGKARRFTMYASARDEVLFFGANEAIYGNPRAGDANNLTVVPPVETIDATNVDCSYLGHAYYGDNRHVVEDQLLLIKGKHPDERLLERVVDSSGAVYWRFRR